MLVRPIGDVKVDEIFLTYLQENATNHVAKLGQAPLYGRVTSRSNASSRVKTQVYKQHLPYIRIRKFVKEVAMPSASKEKKARSTTGGPVVVPAIEQGIQGFGKISKSQVHFNDLGLGDSKNSSSLANSKKRKLSDIDDVIGEKERQSPYDSCQNAAAPVNQKPSASAEQKPIQKTPTPSADTTRPRKKACRKDIEIETSTKGACFRLQTLALPSSSLSSSASSLIRNDHDTPPSSPLSSDEISYSAHKLPDEIQDLINLHSAFLTALSLHYAHNGQMIPVDLRDLVPGIERVWKKRKVRADDIQRLLSLQQGARTYGRQEGAVLSLSDYSHGKVCVEFLDPQHSPNSQRRPLKEEELHVKFERNLEEQWLFYKASHGPNPSPTAFVASLSVLPITPCASLPKIAPLLSKGQRRLEDLKSGAIKAQKSPLMITSANVISPSQQRDKQTTARSTDLFSRLKAKQLHQSTLPLPPSSKILARKSALQRLPEIAPILESLAISSKKHCDDDASAEMVKSRTTHVSFTIPTLVQHLQMSLRNPIGKDEAVGCVELLAEVTPEWVGVRKVGKLVTVTIRGSGIGEDKLKERIRTLFERL